MPTRSKLLSAMTLILAGLALAAAGCGDDDDSGGGNGGEGAADGGGGIYGGGGAGDDSGGAEAKAGGGDELKLSADPSGALKFDKTSLTAKPGKVSIVMDNPSDVPHAVGVRGGGVDEAGETVGKDGVSEVALDDLKAGEYEFYCPVGNHAGAGMKGTLTVG